ncbi:hypothetical protein [Cupriavidus yeoncheonensis]|uniref:hypothetical protein n=1 Tax=Cupriavidus yeoncheonensis TaxID=1462994 RepID=UPI001BAA86B6|nr:hypothetical protein [Cupriavidus yeoncheonensis]
MTKAKCTHVVHFAFEALGFSLDLVLSPQLARFFVRMKALCNPIRVECGREIVRKYRTRRKNTLQGRARRRNIVSSVHQLAGTVVYL